MSDTFFAIETWLINDENNDTYRLPLTFKQSWDKIDLWSLENGICFATHNPIEAYESPMSERHSKRYKILAPEGTYTVKCIIYKIDTNRDDLFAYIYTSIYNWGSNNKEWTLEMVEEQGGCFDIDKPYAILTRPNIEIKREVDSNE